MTATGLGIDFECKSLTEIHRADAKAAMDTECTTSTTTTVTATVTEG
jgi:hypothetical protein